MRSGSGLSRIVGLAFGFAWLASATPASATVSPILECVAQTQSGYVAWYGYKSFATKPLSIPIGILNKFVPNPINRGQPTTFQPGRNSFVFAVPFASGTLSWKLSLGSATASASSTRCSGVTLQPAVLPSGEIGKAYQAQLVGSGGVGALTYQVTGLPSGLGVSASGLISGTPTSEGTFPVHATVRDSLGQEASRDYQLEVFTAVVGCNEDPSAPELVVGGDGDPQAALNRVADACEPVGVLLRTGVDAEQFAELSKPPGEVPATLDIVWEPEAAALPLAVTRIDFDGPGGNAPQDVQFCGGSYLAPEPLEGVPWCLVSQTITLVGGGNLQLTERYYGIGDPRWVREP
jgi:hypothetical protein